MKNKEDGKKGQVTLFIILAIILFIILLFIYLYYSEYTSKKRLTFDRSSVSSYIQSCVDKTSLDGLIIIGKQGLQLNPKEYVTIDKIGFLLKNEKLLMPSRQAIESDLSAHVQNNLLACLDNFDPFKRNLWDVSYENPKVVTSINLNDVSFSVKFPLNVKQQDLTISISEFRARHSIRLFYLHDFINKTLAIKMQEKALDLTELTNYNINLTIFPYQDLLVYAIEDPGSLIANKPYLVMFASD